MGRLSGLRGSGVRGLSPVVCPPGLDGEGGATVAPRAGDEERLRCVDCGVGWFALTPGAARPQRAKFQKHRK